MLAVGYLNEISCQLNVVFFFKYPYMMSRRIVEWHQNWLYQHKPDVSTKVEVCRLSV